ncbi:unnamed protein product [Urochloa decumbens]|uniref:CHCH domain-containing protein n=1 Tax=Urochloa decumbens TaxID=240449 RepID=A0ABC8Y2J0_9POAL
MAPHTVQASANADPCHIHSKDFEDCLNSHEIRLGKCRDHLRLLYQCRQKALAVIEEAAAAAAPAAPMGNTDSCHIPYEKLKRCVNNEEVRLGKCELHLHVLFACHMRARELWS